jgi:hypothetical protein
MADSPLERRELGQRAAQVVQRQRGAAEKTVQMLTALLLENSSEKRSAA